MRREREDSFSDGEDNSAAHHGGTDSFYNDASGNARINKTTDQPMMVNKSKEALQTDKNGFARIEKQPSNNQKRQKEAPVLTFVDMSKLKYLSRSVSSNSKLSRKKPTVVQIPKNTNTAIAEAANEEDEDEMASPDKTKMISTTDQTAASSSSHAKNPQELALEIVNELVDLVLESAATGQPGQD